MHWSCGKIDYVLLGDFKFANRFNDLTDGLLASAIQIVNAEFSGVYRLWSILPPGECKAKRELCINYLIAWWLANSYPDLAIDVSGTGALPVKRKRVQKITLDYRDPVRQSDSGILDMLTTNEFGLQALAMLQAAPEMYMLY